MSRQYKVPQGTLQRETRDLTRQLKGIQTNYRFGIITKKRAKQAGAKVITEHYNTLLALTRGNLGYNLKRPVSLTPEDKRRLDNWRDQAIQDFGDIIDDVK